MSPRVESSENAATDLAIGAALNDLRKNKGLTARQLARDAKVSAAMISRIENGQVPPSISTLRALSAALDVPLVSLFRETAAEYADYTHVKSGKGLRSARLIGEHSHAFVNLAVHTRRDLQFAAHMMTLVRQEARPPDYVGHGVVFLYAIAGKAVYEYGPREIVLETGDSLSLDAELRHGFKEVLSDEFTFLTLQAERR